MLNSLKEYMKMPSTWRGVFMGLGLLGVSFVPEQKEAIISTSLGLIALIETFRKEEK